MRDRLITLFYFTLYWITFMVVIRAVFLLYNHDITVALTASEILTLFLYGLKMDLSMTGYIIMLTGVLLSVSAFISASLVPHSILVINAAFLFVAGAIVIVDMELYRHWGFRLNTTPFLYIGHEAMGSIPVDVVLKTLSILLLLLAVFGFILFTFFSKRLMALKPIAQNAWKTFAVILIISALMFIPIRGSFTVAAMNTGFVYFHKTKAYANHAAINVVWNFMKSVAGGNNVIYPEDFFDKKVSKAYFNELYPKSDSTYHLLTTKRPNIILIILESFTADVIEPLGGIKTIAPNFTQLSKKGILFTNFFASGDRTDKGIVSILSGYPAQPQSSIIKYSAKAEHLPYLNHRFNALGYHTSFVHGGDVDFANIRAYLTNCHFENITTLDDFDSELYTSKWGVHDQYVFDRAFTECDSAQQPFAKVMLTLSSHEPFDVPMEKFIKGDDMESLFLNSCHYTDKCLGAFIQKAEQQDWWKNTLVVLVADHGHRLPYNKELKSKERFRIPMLWLGGALAKRDTIITMYASQTDIANTLLAQLNKTEDDFIFSKNILAPNAKQFAVYFFNDGYGFVQPGKHIVYDNAGKQFFKTDGASEKNIDVSKAYQQTLFEDYNKR